ncbi:MAG: ankyrin repeat domain-containing protein [Pseudomonadota bacterium]
MKGTNTDDTQQTILTAPLVAGDVKKFLALLKTHPDQINTTNYLNETPLIIAVRQGMTLVVEELIKISGLDLHVQSYLLGTALITVITYGQNDIAKRLLALEKEFNAANHPAVMQIAVRCGLKDIIKALHERDPNMINGCGNSDAYKGSANWVWDQEGFNSPYCFTGPALFNLPIMVAFDSQSKEMLDFLLTLKHPQKPEEKAVNLEIADVYERIPKKVINPQEELSVWGSGEDGMVQQTFWAFDTSTKRESTESGRNVTQIPEKYI